LFPAIDVSEYTSWAEVDAWAQRLFALPSPAAPEVLAQVAAFKAKNLKDEALLTEVLRFVQDDVRYFSVSLGESSHRPKPPQQTLAERVGDCKDKTTLLNALLRELGFDAKAALVSVQRNKGVVDYLPTHDIFDHVISRVALNGKVWFLDSTITNQGLSLDTRGQVPYGAALVVGAGVAPQPVPQGLAAADRLEFEQQWDLTQPGQPAKLTTVLRARGLQAEGWRSSTGGAGAEAVSKALAGSFARMLPGLKTSGAPEIVDDRSTNQFELRQRFELPDFGTYNRGAIDTEYLAVDMLDVLSGPADTQRRTPFWVNQPRLVESRITVDGPAPFSINTPAPIEVVHKQFRYSVRLDVQGSKASFVRRYERREDEVPAADLATWREKVLHARQSTSGRLRLPLISNDTLMPELQAVDRRLRSARGWRNDNLQDILARNEFGRVIDTRALARVPAGSTVATKALVSRAQANNLLGDFAAGQNDATLALANLPEDAEALDARAVALLGLGKPEDALATFARITPQARSAATASWMGAVQLHLGRPAEAEPLLRDAVAGGAGEGREWALVWLYLAAERQGGRGTAAIADQVSGTDATRMPGAVLRFMVGGVTREELLRLASASATMERLNLAEAQFYIGQKLLAQGQAAEAQRWFTRTVETQATPYREVTFAKLELARAGR
jgi:lipoprotein NlpI